MSTRRVRGQTQRILLVKVEPKEESIRYSILGTTGTTYVVKQKPKARRYWDCTCPDSTMRKLECKHIFFVQDRVLKGQLDFDESKARCEQAEIEAALWSTAEKTVQPREWIGLDCAVCLEEMSPEEKVHTCAITCGQSVHESCWKRWCKVRGPICVYCRSQ